MLKTKVLTASLAGTPVAQKAAIGPWNVAEAYSRSPFL
jgi:hypothetical protein